MRKITPLIVVLAFLLPASPAIAQKNARQVVDECLKSMSKCKTLSGRIKRSERVDGELEAADMYFKVNYSPYKVYIYNYAPDEGSEVLYVTGWNKNKAYIHPNKFPFVNVSLNPKGDMLLKDRHHTLFDVGFTYTNNVVTFLIDKHEQDFDKYVKKEKDVTYAGEDCYVISINYDVYDFVDYTVLEGEDLIKIDQKMRVPAFKVLELNDDVKDYFDVEAGQVIKIPNMYAEKVVLFISKANMLPIVQIVYDDQGLFEKYEYSKVKFNPTFDPAEFTTKWHEYEF